MAAGRQSRHLEAGDRAPDVAGVGLRERLGRGPVLLVFFKTTCPVCDMTLPFLARVPMQVVGISQDEEAETRAFVSECGVAFPIVLDEADEYAIGEAYGIASVPAFFLIGVDGRIEAAWEGFSRGELARVGVEFREEEKVPEWKMGCSSKNG